VVVFGILPHVDRRAGVVQGQRIAPLEPSLMTTAGAKAQIDRPVSRPNFVGAGRRALGDAETIRRLA
jgi:hypothetical protein